MFIGNKKSRVVSALLALAVLLAAIPAAPLAVNAADGESVTAVIYENRFERDPFADDWDAVDDDGDGSTWYYDGGSAIYHSSRGVVRSDSRLGAEPEPKNSLLSYPFTMPRDGVTTVSIRARTLAGGSTEEKLSLGVRMLYGTTVYPLIEDVTVGGEWKELSAELPGELRGARVMVVLTHLGGTGGALLADDFTVVNERVLEPKVFTYNVYKTNFTNDPFTDGWSSNDLDGDGHCWVHDTAPMTWHSAGGAMWSASYDDANVSPLDPKNELVSPSVYVPKLGLTTVGFWARGTHRTAYTESFSVSYLLEGEARPRPVSEQMFTSGGWEYYSFIVPDEARGSNVSFIITHYDSAAHYRLYIDDFEIINRTSYPENTLYAYNFETDPLINGWRFADVDGDGRTWNYDPNTRYYCETPGAVWSASYEPGVGPLSPDNRLITPQVTLSPIGDNYLRLHALSPMIDLFSGDEFDVYYQLRDSHFPVMLNAAPLAAGPDDWSQFSFLLPEELAGETVNFIIRHAHTANGYALYIDDLSVYNEAWDFMRGDLDRDMRITVSDALRALRFAAQFETPTAAELFIGDIDGDGVFTVRDALAILRVAVGLADPGSL